MTATYVNFKLFKQLIPCSHSDIFTRAEGDLANENKMKTLRIFNISVGFDQMAGKFSDDRKASKCIRDIKTLTIPSQIKNQVAAVTTRQQSRNQSKVIEDNVTKCNHHDGDETPLLDSKVPLLSCNDPIRDITPITRQPGHQFDLDRDRLYKEMRNKIQDVTDPVKQATIAHRAWHQAPLTLVANFGISRNEAEKIVNDCRNCDHLKQPHRHIRDKLRPIRCPDGPGLIHSMDIKYLSMESGGPRYLLGCYDIFSKFIMLEPLQDMSSATIFETMTRMYKQSGFPNIIRIDGQSSFHASEMKAYLVKRNTLLQSIAPHRSNASPIWRIRSKER